MALTKTVAAAAAIGLLITACGTDSPLTGVEAGGEPLSAPVTTTVTTDQQTTPAAPDAAAATTAPTTTAPAPSSTAPSSTAAPSNPFPDPAAIDVATGQSVNLRSLGETGTPTVLWFWYPH